MIVFIYGEDNFRSVEKLKKLKEEFFKKNTSNATSSVFDFSQDNFSIQLKTSLKARGLFSQNSLTVVKNLLGQEVASLKNEIVDFLADNLQEFDSSDSGIIFWESKLPKKNDKVFKWLLNNVKSEEFKKLNDAQTKKWIEDKFLSFDIKITSSIANDLINNKSGDLASIDKEILKIVNFIGQDKLNENLNAQIAKLINSNVEANIFQTIEFISAGNKKQAMRMLHKQLEQGDDPFYILSMYVYQFRNLLKIAEFHFQGRTDYTEIARITKVHPFVVQKGMQQLRGFDYEKLKELYQRLEKIDQEAKSGKMNINLGLDLFVASL